jgi:hypothetical protein
MMESITLLLTCLSLFLLGKMHMKMMKTIAKMEYYLPCFNRFYKPSCEPVPGF